MCFLGTCRAVSGAPRPSCQPISHPLLSAATPGCFSWPLEYVLSIVLEFGNILSVVLETGAGFQIFYLLKDAYNPNKPYNPLTL